MAHNGKSKRTSFRLIYPNPPIFSIRVLGPIREAIFIVATICNALGAIEGKPAEADDLGPT